MNKKKCGYAVFLAVCFALCILPFAGMAVAPTDGTIGNQRPAKFPSVTDENGKLNTSYLSELGSYFEDHFAFRPQMVSADAAVMTKVFKTSPQESVICGTDGWLYYASTRDDYIGKDLMSDRALYNAAHNLSLMRDYVEGRGADFLLTVPPNKNSLYGENMPYYDSRKISKAKNIEGLTPLLAEFDIAYLDLFDLFSEKNGQIWYLKRDSHWNNEGAMLVYNTLFDRLGWDHDSYVSVRGQRSKDEIGDLSRMLFPVWAEPEWNTVYPYERAFSFADGQEDVEAARIRTDNPNGSGSLLMFRDSFGNSLLPLAANAVKTGYFYKTQPYDIAALMDEAQPDAVVVEKVERNLREFASQPAVMPAPKVNLSEADSAPKTVSDSCSLYLHSSDIHVLYYEAEGMLDESITDGDSSVYVRVRTSASDTVYEAFTVSDEQSDYRYLLYLPKDKLTGKSAAVSVYVRSKGRLSCVMEQEFTAEEIEE